MHPEAFDAVGRIAKTLGLDGSMLDALDIGGQPVNGSTHAHFRGATWTIVDIADVPGVDIVVDATTWEPPRTWDMVQSTECLEHVENWRGIVTTAAKALKPGGYLILTCASTGRRPHGANGEMDPIGQYYGNVDPGDFEAHAKTLFAEVSVEYNPNPGDLYAWAKK
jgi:SAM-dependent methyltransferase